MQSLATTQFTAVLAIAEAIRELGSVPSGHLYAQVINHLSLDQYESAIQILVGQKLVTRTNNELVWSAK